MELIHQGLAISAIGLIAAFLFMLLIISVMIGLQKLFPAGSKTKAASIQPETLVSDQAFEEAAYEDEEAIAAVIAVALAHARTRSHANLGAGLLSGRSLWWSLNQLASRRK
ncbi:MAG: OadG family protein [Anaerolineaceae bacterium]|nr:OadG family protein [Anaerolineaceae bacterium]